MVIFVVLCVCYVHAMCAVDAIVGVVWCHGISILSVITASTCLSSAQINDGCCENKLPHPGLAARAPLCTRIVVLTTMH